VNSWCGDLVLVLAVVVLSKVDIEVVSRRMSGGGGKEGKGSATAEKSRRRDEKPKSLEEDSSREKEKSEKETGRKENVPRPREATSVALHEGKTALERGKRRRL
jgi:hypothetical protein